MYINVSFCEKNKLTLHDVVYLQLVYQNRSEDLQTYIDKLKPSEEIKKYITSIKSGETRLTKDGKALLDKIQLADFHENDEKLADYLLDKYKEENLNICSKSKLLKLISWFRAETSLTHREIYKIIITYFESEESKYNKRLDYLFWKPDNPYGSPKLSESRLYAWYESNVEKFIEP